MNIKGYVDSVNNEKAYGWAFLEGQPERKLIVKVLSGDHILGQGTASLYRSESFEKKFGFADCAFDIPLNGTFDVNSLSVVAYDEGSGIQTVLPFSQSCLLKRGYQQFEDQKGDSNSQKKLETLLLPVSLEGMSVLDIGCNEGFFCLEALRRGASRVVGIDSDQTMIEKAKARDTDRKITYIHDTWWHIPQEKFDLILFLSAIHYEKKQKELLTYLSTFLHNEGMLILECGALTSPDNVWRSVTRWDGKALRYPTISLLKEELLSQYAVRLVGSSVNQTGDPVERHVFHCKKLKPTVLLICGKSEQGKTCLLTNLKKKGIASFSVDQFLMDVHNGHFASESMICQDIRKNCRISHINLYSQRLIDENLVDAFLSEFFSQIPFEGNTVAIEGYTIGIPVILERAYTFLEEMGCLVWKVERL